MNLIRFAERMKIVFTKGQYSPEYVNFYMRNFGVSPFTNCLKKTFSHYLSPFYVKDAPVIPTSLDIKFGETPFGFRFEEMLKMKGYPNCFTVDNVESDCLKVISYKETVIKSSMNVMYFFLNNCFFFGEYRFSDVTFLNVDGVIHTLLKRYKVNVPDKSDTFFIGDPSGNKIYYVFNGITVSIYYYSRLNTEINKSLDTYMNRKEVSDEDGNDLGSLLARHF